MNLAYIVTQFPFLLVQYNEYLVLSFLSAMDVSFDTKALKEGDGSLGKLGEGMRR